LASTAVARIGAITTMVASLMRSVTPAAAASVPKGSCES
jgi:hypothetical protein